MLEAKIKSEILKEVVEAASLLIDEGKFSIGQDEISLKAVDPAHIALIELGFSTTAFDVFNASPMELGVNLDKLKKVIRLASPQDIMTLKLDEEANRLNISFANLSHRMALLDSSTMREPKTPNVALSTKTTLNGSDLAQGIRAASTISDYIILTATPEALELSCKGDTDAINVQLSKDSLVEHQCQEKVRSLFSLEYLSNLMKIIKPTDAVCLSLGNDLPVKIDFDIAEGKGKVSYLLAPRIEPD
jgi:proliferating cell nuclear antigen